jgi:hypothetical protein
MSLLDEYAARAYLGGRFNALARAVLATDIDSALDAARQIGWPVVLKASVDGIGHKSDFHGVELNIAGPDELRAAYERLLSAAQVAGHGQALRGILVEERLAGAEFIIGAIRDEAFGPVVMVGSGGVLAELLRDTVFRLAPVDAAEAERAILETRAARFLTGFRGSPPLPVGPLAEAIAAASRIIADDPDVLELDINPFILGPHGGAAADLLVLTR